MLIFQVDPLKYWVEFYDVHWKTVRSLVRLDYEGMRSSNLQGLATAKKDNSIHT